MTITSGFVRPGRPARTVVTTLIGAPEPVDESIGVDDPKTAHGGHSRRTPGPPVTGGLVIRVRPPVALPTSVRRIRVDAYGVARRDDQPGTRPSKPTDPTAEAALLGR